MDDHYDPRVAAYTNGAMTKAEYDAFVAAHGHGPEAAPMPGNRHRDEVVRDRLYLDLKGARERLCLSQMLVPAHWRSDLQAALDHIDQVGSAVCPQQWSRFDQPEYAERSDG